MSNTHCIDNSNNFLNNLFKDLDSKNNRNDTKKRKKTTNTSNSNKNNSQKKLSKKNNNNNENNADKKDKIVNLDWLKKYVAEKVQQIVDYNFNDFTKLFDLYHQSSLRINVIENSRIQKIKLERIVGSLPRYFIWDENKTAIIKSLIDTSNNCKHILIEYFFERHKGTIELFYKNNQSLTDINKELKLITKIIGFYATYTTIKGIFTKLPNLKIFYTDINKCLPKKEKILGQEEINSAFTLENEIILYRKQEILKIIIHELQHFYRFDFGGRDIEEQTIGLKKFVERTYNISSHRINPTESYAETNATILNVIFSLKTPITKEKLSTVLFEEMMFALYQTAKLLNFQKFENSTHIFKDKLPSSASYKEIVFRQQTFAFEYHYLKTKLLFNYNTFLDYINNIHIYNEKNNIKNKELLNLKFPRRLSDNVIKPEGDLFTNFGIELLMFDEDFDKALNIIMKIKPKDINLRMTKTEILA